MKRLLFFTLLLCSGQCFGQAYISMPVDSATWRYRIYDFDYLTRVSDNILFLNGQDTLANGITYHKIMSRTCTQVGGPGFNPPYVTIDATIGDFYQGAIRESGKQFFLLAGAGEQLIYDFNVSVGDSIPAYTVKDKVTAIDSVWLKGVYHKRYLTTDSTYFVIEGVGSNRGLLPGIYGWDLELTRFVCLSDNALTYEPDTTFPCTYIYPAGYISAVANVNEQLPDVTIYPVPANDVLHINIAENYPFHAFIFDVVGSLMWRDDINGKAEISVRTWPAGIYYLQLMDKKTGAINRKFVVQ